MVARRREDRDGTIFVLPARGGKPPVVAKVRSGADAQFSWSPDGTRIAFFGFGSAGTLVVVRVGRRMRVSRTAALGGATAGVSSPRSQPR